MVTTSEKIKIDYKFITDYTNPDGQNSDLVNVKKEQLEGDRARNKFLLNVLLDSKLQLELCAYSQIVTAMSFTFDEKFQEEEEEGKRRRVVTALQAKDYMKIVINDFNLDYKKTGQLPTKYNEDLQKFRKELETNPDKSPDNLLFYEKGDLVIYNDYVYEFLFDSNDEDKIHDEELFLPIEGESVCAKLEKQVSLKKN